MKKTKKPFRLNVVVSYTTIDCYNFRKNLFHNLLMNLASIYRFDFANDHQVFDEKETFLYEKSELFYFRSTEHTLIDGKYFRNLISQVFHYSSTSGHGVEVFYQLQSALKEFPFPKNFHRHLTYPFVDVHQDSQISRYIYPASLDALDIED